MNIIRVHVGICMLVVSSHTMASTCKITSTNDFLNLIKSKHQVNAQAKVAHEMFAANIESAQNLKNPELETEVLRPASNELSTMVKLTQAIELGGKRDARKKLAIKQGELGKLSLVNEKEKVILKNIINLYRLRQVTQLIPIYQEAHHSLLKVLKKKRKLGRSLSPAQEVEFETLSLAVNDYFLKLSELKAEKDLLLAHLTLNTGGHCLLSEASLPKEFKFLPISSSVNQINESSSYKKSKLELSEAQALYDLAKSNAYSDLKIGPMYEYSKKKSQEEHAFGISLTFSLPIFDQNDSQKAKGLAAVKHSEYGLRYQQADLQMDFRNWLHKYKRYEKVFKSMSTQDVLEKKHQRIEKLFDRGVISTSLIIEAHRQMVDFSNRRNDFEIGAVEALWNIYLLRGTILEEQI